MPTPWSAASPEGRAGAGSRGCEAGRARARRRAGGRLRAGAGAHRRVVHAARRRADGRPRPQRRRQDDAVRGPARRAAPAGGRRRRAGALRRRRPDRALAAGLPGQRPRRRADGRDRAPAVVAAPGPRRAPGRARRARRRRPRRRRRRHFRRPLRWPAPARAGGARARPGRPGDPARRAVHRPGQRERRAPRGADRATGERGPRADDRHLRRRAGPRLGHRPVPQPPPGRVRRSGRRPRPGHARGDLRRRHRRPAGRRRTRRAAGPPPLMGALAHALGDPWADPVGRRALLEVALLGVTGGALGCWIVFYNLSYAAESVAHALLPGLVVAALVGLPLVLGAAGGLLVAALAVALAGQVPAIGRDTAVAVVVTTLFGAGVLMALSPASPPGLQGLLFGDVLGLSGASLALAAGLAVVAVAALVVLHGRLLAVGFDRASARA